MARGSVWHERTDGRSSGQEREVELGAWVSAVWGALPWILPGHETETRGAWMCQPAVQKQGSEKGCSLSVAFTVY